VLLVKINKYIICVYSANKLKAGKYLNSKSFTMKTVKTQI
jgi:hypothetical protein